MMSILTPADAGVVAMALDEAEPFSFNFDAMVGAAAATVARLLEVVPTTAWNLVHEEATRRKEEARHEYNEALSVARRRARLISDRLMSSDMEADSPSTDGADTSQMRALADELMYICERIGVDLD